ncbi:MAG: hypothetical protein ACKVS6_13705 [Planctomycetota bacterium]
MRRLIRSFITMTAMAAVAAFAAPESSAQVGPVPVCSISGFTTIDYGQGSGFIGPMVAHYSFNAADCAIDIKIEAPSCCNTYFQGFYLMFGTTPLPPGAFPLPSPPFWSGSDLLIIPDDAIGLFPGNTGSVMIPPNPQLPGMTFYLQNLGVYFTTIGFSTDYGVSQGTAITFS